QPVPDLAAAGLPTDLAAVLEVAMSHDRDERHSTAVEFGEQLREVQRRHGLVPDELPIPVPASEPGEGLSPLTTPTPDRRHTSGRHSVRTPPVPATRFRPPAPTRALVERARLTELLDRGRSRRLSVIHGPTGFGKSTLAAQWFRVLTAE